MTLCTFASHSSTSSPSGFSKGNFGLYAGESVCERNQSLTIMSQSIPTGYTPPPPRAPPEKTFLRGLIPATGAIFCLIPCPGAKNDGGIPRGWGRIFPNSKKLLRIKLAKLLKKLRRLRDSKTTRKSLNTPALIFK